MPTNLNAGDAAVIGFGTSMHDGTGNPDLQDTISIVLLTAIDANTSFFLTDRTWTPTGGSSAIGAGTFSNSGTDGTYTYSTNVALAAGTVITITQAQLAAQGVDFDFVGGESVYIYQGTANAPTSFIAALEAGDNNTTFNASLVNTGLSTAAGTAVANAFDVGAYAGPTTHAGSFLFNGAGVTLLQSIADSSNWSAANQGGQNAPVTPVQTGPWLVAPNVDIWGVAAGGGGGIINLSADPTVSSGASPFNSSILYNGLVDGGGNGVFWHLSDMVFDTVDGKFFVVDSDLGGGHNRILQGNISDLLGNPGTVPTLTVLYSDPSTATDASNRLDNLEVDVANNLVYFTHAGQLLKVNYNTANQAGTVLFDANVSNATSASGVGNIAGSTSNFFNDMAIDFGTGSIYLSSTRVGTTGSSDSITRNYIYELTGLTSGSGTNAFTFGASNTGSAHFLTFAQNDANYDPFAGTAAGTHSTPSAAQPYFFPKERGSLDGLAIDPVTHTLYFSTGEILFDHDANSGTAAVYAGGVVASYALTGNAAGNYTVLFQQPAQSSGAVYGLMGDLEIDTVSGKWYVTDYNGTNGSLTDQHIWSGNLSGSGTPQQFSTDIGNVNGLSTIGFTLNHAPTLSGTGLSQAVTEASAGLGSGETTRVALYSGTSLADIDTSDSIDELSGAVVRIATGFQSGGTHQDMLRINGNTSGTLASGISYTYNGTTGAMVLTGSATVAEYKAAIEAVTFSTSGDDPTAYGTDTGRTIAVSVSDGLSMSDEIVATVSVEGLNDAPVDAVPGTQTITEDGTRLFSTGNANALSVSDVDSNPASQALSVTLSVAHGTLTLASLTGLSFSAGDGTGDTSMTFTGTANAINAALATGLTYTATLDYFGNDALHVVTSDQGFNGTGGAQTDTDDVAITINAVADIANDTLVVGEDAGATSLNVLANDSFENSGRAITAVGSAGHGTVTINDNGTVGNATDDYVVYTAAADFNGTDSFTYTVTSGGATETATVNVTVNAVADIANDVVTVSEDSGANALNLLANDSFENAGRSITAVGSASHGTVAIDDNGTAGDTTDDFVTYTPSADYNGSDSFTYTVTSGGVTETATATVTVIAVADIANDSVTVDEDSGANSLDLLSNDSFENAGRAITAVGSASHGIVSINDNGTAGDTSDDYVTYTPVDNYNGSDSFTYTVTANGTTETATVSVTVNPVNDAPQILNLDDAPSFTEGGAPVLLDGDAVITDLDMGSTGTFDGTTLSLSRSTGSDSGDVFGGSGSLSFTGSGSGNVLLGATVVGTYSQASGALEIDFGPNSDETSVAGVLQQLTYANTSDDPPSSVTIDYVFSDGGMIGGGTPLTAVDTVTVSITPVDDAPVAVNDHISTDEATVLGGDLTADNGSGADYDVDGPGLSVVEVNGQVANVGTPVAIGAGGLLTVNADGTFSFDPNHAYDSLPSSASGGSNTTATETFTYSLGGNTATVTLTINGLDSDDTVLGTDGSDNLHGGVGINTVSYANASGAVTVSLAKQGVVQDTIGSGSDRLEDFRNLTGSTHNDTLTGDANANVIDGGLGSDQMYGGAGNDTFVVDNSGDRVFEKINQGTDTVLSSVTFSVVGQYVENLTLTGSANINGTGNSLNNVLRGNDGINVLAGGTGDDTYYVQNSGDLVRESTNQGYDTVYSSATFSIRNQYVEALYLTGSADINATGNNLNNLLVGNDGTNVLTGGGGDDVYVIQNIGDTAVERDGEGTDRVESSVTFSLMGQFVENLTLTGTDAINGTGNSLANVLTGNVAANTLAGGRGDDTYVVSTGDQVIELDQQGHDTVRSDVSFSVINTFVEDLVLTGTAAIDGRGNSLDNHMTGNDASNRLDGNDGNDVLDGGLGADDLRGGIGNDTYYVDNAGDQVIENGGEGTDTVYSSVSFSIAGQYVETLVLTGTDAIVGHGNNQDNTIIGNDAVNRLTGLEGNDTLQGGGGDDEIEGGVGNDVLTGGTGADKFYFETALDAATNVDTITDFTTGVDHIVLDNEIFRSLENGTLAPSQFVDGTVPQDRSDKILYDSATGFLYYDADGSGTGASAVHFATVTPGTALSAADFTII